jgi:hypothetical protein
VKSLAEKNTPLGALAKLTLTAAVGALPTTLALTVTDAGDAVMVGAGELEPPPQPLSAARPTRANTIKLRSMRYILVRTPG